MNNHSDSSNLVNVISTRYGEISVPTESEDLIVQFLTHYGEWAYLVAQFIASFLPKKARVLDIGAYLGTFSLGLAQIVDLEFVAMVEANPIAIKFLEQNASNLHCPYAVIEALVVDPRAGNISEGWAATGNMGSASYVNQPNSDVVRIEPSRERLQVQDLVHRFGPLHLVKMDVEGMEKQLVSSYPRLLSDAETLLWLECTESPASLALCQLLLDTGRPLTYFAWPSHNANNYSNASEKIFSFAHEAGLLLGAEPKPLTREQQKAECIVRRIFTLEDLYEAMWSTPRWAPPEWDQFNRSQLAAVAGNTLLGKRRETFLRGPSIAEPDNRAPPNGHLQDEIARKEAQIFRLRRVIGDNARLQHETTRVSALRLREVEESNSREKVELEKLLLEAQNLAQQLSAQLANAGEARNQERAELLDQVYESAKQAQEKATSAQVLQRELDGMRGSVTWRGALRVSRIAGRIPYLKRTVKFVLRKKKQLMQR